MALKPARLQWFPDGSLRSLDYGDIYFQRGKGVEESRYVFLEKNNLPERFPRRGGGFHIAELGFGTGLNFLLTAELFAAAAPPAARLFYASVDKHPLEKKDLEKIHAHFDAPGAFALDLQRQYPPLTEGFHHLSFLEGRIRLMLCFGDVADVLPQISGMYDAWYLDGFAPAKNAAMWDEHLFHLIFARIKSGGTLATFSSAGQVRRGLQAAGFKVGKTEGYGVKREMTVARKTSGEPLPEKNAAQKIIVIGAGIAGCSVAHALAQKGCDVTILDRRGEPAAETSGNPFAVVYPKLTVDASPLGLYHSHAFSFTQSLLRRLALPSWNACGVLHMDLDEEDKNRSCDIIRRQQYPEDYAELTPEGIFQRPAGFLSPPEFCRALLDHARIKPVFGASVEKLEKKPGGWNVHPKHGESRAADIVVIAEGYDSKNHPETSWLPLQSLRGQITHLRETKMSKDLRHVICHDGYMTPAVNGIHCIGATFRKEKPETPRLRHEDHLQNLAKLNLHLPQFGFGEKDMTGGRAGYRAATPDKLPMAGLCPDYASFPEKKNSFHEGLYIATGFGAHGMSGAPLAGEIIASLIAGDPLPVPCSLYEHLKPERFILREMKRRGR